MSINGLTAVLRPRYHADMAKKNALTREVREALKILGSIGGTTRAKNLSKERRAEIARKASRARWARKKRQRMV